MPTRHEPRPTQSIHAPINPARRAKNGHLRPGIPSARAALDFNVADDGVLVDACDSYWVL
jgi:hypothetical protein